MIPLIFLILGIFFILIREKYENKLSDVPSIIVNIVILIFFIIFFTIFIRCQNYEELNNYIAFGEKYKIVKDCQKVEVNKNVYWSKEFKNWDEKIESYKHQNTSYFDIFIPDKKLEQAVELRKEIN